MAAFFFVLAVDRYRLKAPVKYHNDAHHRTDQ